MGRTVSLHISHHLAAWHLFWCPCCGFVWDNSMKNFGLCFWNQLAEKKTLGSRASARFLASLCWEETRCVLWLGAAFVDAQVRACVCACDVSAGTSFDQVAFIVAAASSCVLASMWVCCVSQRNVSACPVFPSEPHITFSRDEKCPICVRPITPSCRPHALPRARPTHLCSKHSRPHAPSSPLFSFLPPLFLLSRLPPLCAAISRKNTARTFSTWLWLCEHTGQPAWNRHLDDEGPQAEFGQMTPGLWPVSRPMPDSVETEHWNTCCCLWLFSQRLINNVALLPALNSWQCE